MLALRFGPCVDLSSSATHKDSEESPGLVPESHFKALLSFGLMANRA